MRWPRWPSYGSLGEPDGDGLPAHRSVRAFRTDGDRTNEICTSKYQWWNFIPLNLYEQFHNRANVYFLIIAMLQTVPSISITSGRPLLLMPLSFVLTIAAVRDFFEDWQRKAADRVENERTVMRLDADGRLQPARWRTVRPGDVLRLMDGDPVPADAVLLDSSDPAKTCRVETSSLDGESDLKEKASAVPQGLSLSHAARLRLDFELPSADLYGFQGALVEERGGDGQQPLGVGIGSLLLRGSAVQQVQWADCLVCYCGHETRIMKNQKAVHFKLSELDRQMNAVILTIFATQLVLCIVGGIYHAVWESLYLRSHWYLVPGGEGEFLPPVARSVQKAGTWLLQLNNMVPISLMVMLTTVKFIQGKLVDSDEACPGASPTQKGAEVHTSQVLESLGQITHVFSDKTGTLTCNHMVYKACSVAGRVYGLDQPGSPGERQDEHVSLGSGKAAFLSAAESSTRERQAAMARFLLCHALCHTVTVKREERSPGRGRPEAEGLSYQAASPDELALVSAARELGLCYAGHTGGTCSLRVRDARLLPALEAECGPAQAGTLEVEVLALCEFDNDRKRMSVVVRYPNGRKVLLVKGADTSVLPDVADSPEKEQAAEHLGRLAGMGLRTLCLAGRVLEEPEYAAWAQRYREALAELSSDRMDRVRQLASELETGRGLKLLGVTAIEDQLQEGVPECLEHLREAGITIWVLTGDKVETAISIGKSCRLLAEGVQNIQIVATDRAGLLEALRVAQGFGGGAPAAQWEEGCAITISGAALAIALEDADLRGRFYNVALRCRTVLCCRVTPRQKAEVVELVQALHRQATGVKPVTLAIGDGANDVSMIAMADVGVGLSGKEGAQAARSADFALGQFRFLQRLLFVHGRESYRRNSTLVSYNFYKNMVLVLPPFLYGPCMAFSGQPFYEQVLYQFYNVFFTFFPCVCFAVLDRPVQNLAELQWNPWSYVPGREKRFFNFRVFLCWMSAAVLQGCFLPLAAFTLFSDGSRSSEGPSVDSLWLVGTGIFFWVVLGVNLTLARRLSVVLPLTVVAFAGSVSAFPILTLLLDETGSPFLRGIFALLFGHQSLRYALATCLVMVAFLLIGEPLLARAEPDGDAPPRAGLPKPPIGSEGHEPMTLGLAAWRG